MLIVQNEKLKIEKLTLGQYETNTYILVWMETKESLVVDAPANASEIIAHIKGTVPKYILLTHDHFDHTGVIVSLRGRLHAPLATHEYSSYQLKTPPERLLKDGDILKLGRLKIKAFFTPGHTPGSMCFRAGNYLFAGDTVFPGGPGHTETPEDFRQILTSINEKIYKLPDDTMVLPGHGDSTTVKQSKKESAFFMSKPHNDLFGDVTWQSNAAG